MACRANPPTYKLTMIYRYIEPAILLLAQQGGRRISSTYRAYHHVCLKVEDLLQLLEGHVQQGPNLGGQALEENQMWGHGRGQVTIWPIRQRPYLGPELTSTPGNLLRRTRPGGVTMRLVLGPQVTTRRSLGPGPKILGGKTRPSMRNRAYRVAGTLMVSGFC